MGAEHMDPGERRTAVLVGVVWGALCLAALTALVLFWQWRHAAGQSAWERYLKEDPPVWIDDTASGPPDLRLGENLTLVAELGGLRYHEREEHLVATAEREGLAPLSSFYASPDIVVGAPEAMCSQVPPQGPETPDFPDPPAWWTEQDFRDTAAGGPLAAALYTPHYAGGGELLINHAAGGVTREFSVRLREDFEARGELVVCRNGEGLLVKLGGHGPGDDDWDEWVSDFPWDYEVHILLCEAPRWEPIELYSRKEREYAVTAWLIGQTADGAQVFIRLDESYADRDTETCLLEIDTVAGTCKQTARGWDGGTFIPSPDGRFLAEGVAAHLVCETEMGPVVGWLWLIDRRDGSFMPLNRRIILGGYVYSAVGWSADVPGRLYFTDERDRLWRVDLPTEGTLADAVDE